MPWYYAIDSTRLGPIAAAELAELSRMGTLSAEDLAWREGLPNWEPFRRVAGEVFAEAAGGEAGSTIETAVCAHSGRALPVAELVPYGERWVDPRHKEAFVQRLMETGGSGLVTIPEDHDAPEYVGFWWRVLGWIVDYFVMLVPGMLCMIPYFISAFGSGMAASTDPNNPNPFNGWTAAMAISYVLGILGQFAVYWLNPLIMTLIMAIGFGIGLALMFAAGVGSAEAESPGLIVIGVISMAVFGLGGFLLGLFPFWMAGRDPEKRALHDRICSTRVVKK